MNTPFICPVCKGNGLVPNGFYNQTGGAWTGATTNPEKCRSCDGTGIVWERELSGTDRRGQQEEEKEHNAY